MDRSDVITLLSVSKAQNDYGVWVGTETGHDVFARVESVTRAEFFNGGRNGLNPQYVFTVFFGDYNGEPIVIYKGLAYSIYRTYHARTDELELYAERKGGTNGKEDSSGD